MQFFKGKKMTSNPENWAIEIHTGIHVYQPYSVFLKFRRPADSDVIQDLRQFCANNRWELRDLRKETNPSLRILTRDADLEVKCCVRESSDVGNELATILESDHGLKCRRLQVIGKFGSSKLYFVKRLRKAEMPTPSDFLADDKTS